MAVETTAAGQRPEGLAGLAGKYLTFRLGPEEYGLEILQVREIIGLMDITMVPRTPEWVRGVINLRGKVIPVVDLRLKFAMEPTPDTNQTCIIVVEVAHGDDTLQMGVVVDEVSEVRDISADMIDATPAFGSSVETEFILGMGKVGSAVVMLLDINRVLSTEEMSVVDQVAG